MNSRLLHPIKGIKKKSNKIEYKKYPREKVITLKSRLVLDPKYALVLSCFLELMGQCGIY